MQIVDKSHLKNTIIRKYMQGTTKHKNILGCC